MDTISHSFPGEPVVADIASCEPHAESFVPTRKKQRLITPLILTMGALVLSGCAGGITGIKLDPSSHTVCDRTGAVCGLSDSARAVFQVLGQGQCGGIAVKFGDGEQATGIGNFDIPLYFGHEYTAQTPLVGTGAWPGPKTVHAYSYANCSGEAKMPVYVLRKTTSETGQIVFHSVLRIVVFETAVACTVVPNTRPVRRGSKISITEAQGGPMMNFGCAGNDCINDTGGDSGATHPGFPFPALRRHSLVLRIVSASGEEQVEQGQPVTRFVARVDGPLEFCVNDTVLTDNSGAWAVDVLVDETTVP